MQTRLNAVTLPAPLKIYMTPACMFCPKTVAAFLDLAVMNPNIHPHIIDGDLFSEMAAADQVRSVPTVILDDRFRWTGTIDPAEVLKMMAAMDPAQLSTDSLKNMINTGDAQKVAQMMLDSSAVFPAVVPILTHPKWSVRIGAMVVFEYLAEGSSELAMDLAARLQEAYPDLDDAIKGDIIYMFGQSGIGDFRPWVEQVLQEPVTAEVEEAAKEALDALNAGR